MLEAVLSQVVAAHPSPVTSNRQKIATFGIEDEQQPVEDNKAMVIDLVEIGLPLLIALLA